MLEDGDAEEFFEFVLGLHGLGLLVVPGIPPETVWRRREERRRRQRKQRLGWLVSWRIPLGDPDRWLQRVAPYVTWLYRLPGLALWAMLGLFAFWQCGDHLGELFGDAGELLSLHNLPIVWLSVVVLKALHELGHAFALKRYGAIVPEIGIIFVFLTPCAYVDANGSWTFRSKWQRIVVALGGMYVETMIAFVFALIWAGTPPGLLHSVAQSVVVLATVTTVLVNINPLIKFDGYFAFSDLVGIYNLQERARENLRGHLEHWFLGLPRRPSNASFAERSLLWVYAPAALAYRASLAIGVTALMMTSWPAIGIPLGMAFAWLLIVGPLLRIAKHLWSSERLENVRLRARVVTVLCTMFVIVAVLAIPVSDSIVAPGLLDPGSKWSVRAPSSGFVDRVDVLEGTMVGDGVRLCKLRAPELEERLVHVEAELRTARVHHDATEIVDTTTARMLANRIDSLERRLAELRSQSNQLEVRSYGPGTVVGSRALKSGSYIRKGEELMQVHSQHRFVRVVLTDEEIDRLRLEPGVETDLRWTNDPWRTVRATVREARRSASRDHVPVELTVAAGGEIFAKETEGRVQADRPYLHVFLQVEDEPLESFGSGMTARVRFAARTQTIGDWCKRGLLQFFYNWSSS